MFEKVVIKILFSFFNSYLFVVYKFKIIGVSWDYIKYYVI